MTLQIFDLTGKRALITGSSQGIGFALARGLAGAGAEIVLNGRDGPKLDAAAKTLQNEGAIVHQLAFDVTNHEEVLEIGKLVVPKLAKLLREIVKRCE